MAELPRTVIESFDARIEMLDRLRGPLVQVAVHINGPGLKRVHRPVREAHRPAVVARFEGPNDFPTALEHHFQPAAAVMVSSYEKDSPRQFR